MATLGDVRAQLRRQLDDTTAAPLWNDAALNDALAAALAAYSAAWPDESRTTLAVSAGTTSLPLPPDTLAVVRLLDPTGAPVEGWQVVAGQLSTPPLAAGSYTLVVRRPRAFPASDTAAFPVPDADVPLVVAEAACRALELRLVADAKRGPLPPDTTQALAALRARATAEWTARSRRVRPASVVW
ncbi:hypothetical protein [Thermorudis peleae]|uniref:hypothetical protein n=1 Tax=Thermorudis peleae TaxID=1382356 RepID=UPI000692330B|nr:hypothetical protein [Thermorudis peleae]